MIIEGRVTVNGNCVRNLGALVRYREDVIRVDGHEIPMVQNKIVLIMFNKPKNMICSHKDKEGRPTIFSKLPPSFRSLLIAGRLDYHSEGLLLLTNDGELLFRLTHPSHHVEKRYLVKFKGHLDEERIAKLRQGIELSDGITQPVEMMKREATEVNDWFEMALEEGRYRQIRRMGEAVGHRVLKIKRMSIGPIRLVRVLPGKYRELTRKEQGDLYKAVGLYDAPGDS